MKYAYSTICVNLRENLRKSAGNYSTENYSAG